LKENNLKILFAKNDWVGDARFVLIDWRPQGDLNAPEAHKPLLSRLESGMSPAVRDLRLASLK